MKCKLAILSVQLPALVEKMAKIIASEYVFAILLFFEESGYAHLMNMLSRSFL